MKVVKTFKTDQYLGENDKLIEFIRNIPKDLWLISAPTGSGKSRLMALLSNSTKKRTLILSPFIILGDNIQTEIKNVIQDSNSKTTVSVIDGRVKDKENAWKADIVVATYDQFIKQPDIHKNFDRVWIDEPQTIYEDAYRGVMSSLYKKLIEVSRTIPVIALSATLIEGLLSITKTINVTTEYAYEPDIRVIPDALSNIKAYIINHAIKAKDDKKLLVVLFNNKDILVAIEKALREIDVQCTLLTADHKDDKRTAEFTKTQICKTPVLLMTKAGQAGLSVNNDKDSIYRLIVKYDDGMTPESLKQFYSRCRKQHKPRVDILVDAYFEDSVDSLQEWFNERMGSRHILVQDCLDRATAALDDVMVSYQYMLDNPDLEKLVADNLTNEDIPAGITLDDVRNYSGELDYVHIAQKAEMLRAKHYSYNLNRLFLDSVDGVSYSRSFCFSDDNWVHDDLETVVDKANSAIATKRARKKAIYKTCFEHCIKTGSSFSLFDIIPNDNPIDRKIYFNVIPEVREVFDACIRHGYKQADIHDIVINKKLNRHQHISTISALKFITDTGIKCYIDSTEGNYIDLFVPNGEYNKFVQKWSSDLITEIKIDTAWSNADRDMSALISKLSITALKTLFESVFKVSSRQLMVDEKQTRGRYIESII